MKRLTWTVALVAAAVLLGGCGEIANTLTPAPGTANTLTVALDAPPNFSHVGIFDAQELGYFTQTDLKVNYIVTKDPLAAIEAGRAQIAVSSEPAILLERNKHVAVAAVAAILQGPQHVLITCRAPGTSTKTGKSTKTGTTTSSSTTTSTPRAHPPVRATRCTTKIDARPDTTYASAPTYNGMNLAVTENEIINHAPILRRFVQAVGRGYTAAKANPVQATQNLVKLYPNLNYAEQLAGVKASIPNFFPTQVGAKQHRPWGFQIVNDWNRFGTYLYDNKTITNVNATPDADSNELLAGQGV